MLKALKELSELLDRKSKVQFVLLFMLLVVKSFFDGFGLGLIVPYIAIVGAPSAVFDNQIFQKVNVYTKFDSSQSLIFWMSIILIGFFIIKSLLSLYVMYYQSRMIFTKRSYQGRALFEAYMNAPYSFHLEHNSAELDRNIRYESVNVYLFVQNFIQLCSGVLFTISISILLLVANWQIVLGIGLFISIFSYMILSFSGRYTKIYGKTVQESVLHIGQAMKEGLSSINETKLYHIESFFPNRYLRHMMTNARANWRQSTLQAAPYQFFEILAMGALLGVVVVFSIRNITIYSVLPMLALFGIGFIRLIPTVTTIITSFQSAQFFAPAVHVVYAAFQHLALLAKQNSAVKKPVRQPIEFHNLKLTDVAFSFPSRPDLNTISDISLTIVRGQAVGITGPSGAGKTTLMNIILGFLQPDRGEVYVNSENIHANLENWQSLIGYVPQVITLIDASIKENVALGFEGDEINTDKVWSVLKEACMDVFVKSLPEKLDTLIGENGVRLSGGQRQRLGLARALYRNPEVLVFDEATSALDMDTEKKITQEIMKLSGKRTLIIVAHRVSTIKDCNVIYYLKDGQIINSGTYSQLAAINRDFRTLIDQSVGSDGG